ncbi:MAG: DNA gyrase inhibitor YacG, partial [Phycisphaerales bacterium JB059]
LVEWGERIEDACPDAARLKIEPTGASSRRFTLTLPGSWADRGGSVNPGEPERRATTCPVTGQRVAPDCPTWPFASERARMADLHKWFSGQHTISRPLEQADLEQGE